MNLLWIRRRQEEELKRKKDEEVQQRVQKWSMDRSRAESENLRKRESTKLVAGLGQILQEGVDQEKPFAWRSSHVLLHPDLATAASNQSAAAVSSSPTKVTKEAKELQQQEDATTRKAPPPAHTRGKPAQIVIKTRKPSVMGGGGMHFRNQLPPNYVPPGLLAASSVPKSRREVSSASPGTRPSLNSKERPFQFSSLEKRTSGISDEASSASEDEEDPATDDNVTRKRRSVQISHHMKLQSYHVPYYYDDTDHLTVAKTPALQKVRKTHCVLSYRCLALNPACECFSAAASPRHNPRAAAASGPRTPLPSRSKCHASSLRHPD
jgi:hypothetical protein